MGVEESVVTPPGVFRLRSSSLTTENSDVFEGERLAGCSGTLICDPQRSCHRFLMLIFILLLYFGVSFCYNIPGALQEHVKEDMKIDTGTYMTLYSFYSWPGVIMALIGGYLIDRVFGLEFGAVIFSLDSLIGQVAFAFGALSNVFWLMVVGRFLLGMGGDSLYVAQNKYAVSWFMGKELNMVFGLLGSFSAIGLTVNMNVMEPLYDAVRMTYGGHKCLGIVLLIASVVCFAAFFSALVLTFFHKRANRILHKTSGEETGVVRILDVKDFPLSFWLIIIICFCYNTVLMSFAGVGNVFFKRKFQFSSANANAVISLVYIICMAASPFVGFAVDKTGRNIVWTFVGILSTTISHCLLAFTFVKPYVTMAIMGFAFSCVATSLWPMVSFIILERRLGMAYGLMLSSMNLFMAAASQVIGIIVDTRGYLVLEVFYLAWLCLALIAVILLWLVDLTREGILNLSADERHRRLTADERHTRLTTAMEIACARFLGVAGRAEKSAFIRK